MDSSSSRVGTIGSSLKDQTRLQIVGSFWIVVLLSLPVWWNTTKIERRLLPEAEVASWNQLKPCPIRFPIKISSGSSEVTTGSLNAQVKRLESLLDNGKKTYHDTIDILAARCFDFHVQSANKLDSGDYVILHRPPRDMPDHSRNSISQKNISIPLLTNNKPKEFLRAIAPLPKSSSSIGATDSRVMKYSSQLKLVFTLMNEDCTQPNFIRHWDIKRAIELYLEESLADLSPLHNFTCQTQILPHAPLAFEPTALSGDHTTYVVEQEELKAFINDADWNLASSVTMDSLLNFVLWVPSSNHRPFKIRRADGSLDHDGSFIRPQWGSVVIYNPDQKTFISHPPRLDVTDLARPMQIFRYHLLSLLGIADTPATSEQRTLALDAIIRRRIVENSLEAINSLEVIVKLINDQTNMRVSSEVQNQVKGALTCLKAAQEELLKVDGSLWTAALHADESKRLSSTAFFSPTMLSLLYFPNEHKYAVYTPLFGPVLVPLIIGLIKELRSLRRKKALRLKEE